MRGEAAGDSCPVKLGDSRRAEAVDRVFLTAGNAGFKSQSVSGDLFCDMCCVSERIWFATRVALRLRSTLCL